MITAIIALALAVACVGAPFGMIALSRHDGPDDDWN